MGCLAAALGLCIPSGAVASSSGEITRAQVNPDWTTASVAGSTVRSNGCIQPPDGVPGKAPGEEFPAPLAPPSSPPGVCGWIPFATVGPGSSQADCSDRDWGSLGDGVQLVWAGPELTGAGSAMLDDTSTALDYGAVAPLLCLSAVETDVATKVCIPEIDCSGYWYVHQTHQLDSALLEPVLGGQVKPTPQTSLASGPQPCKKPRKRLKRAQNQAGVGLGPSIRVQGKGKRVRRCKTS